MAARKPVGLSLSEMLNNVADELDTSIESVYSYVPHEKQKTFHCSMAEERLLIGGNRSGKTVSNVVECIWRLTKTHPFRPDLNAIKEPIRGRIVTVSLKEGLLKIILPLFKKWMPKKFLINRSWEKSYNKEERTLYLVDGSFIEFMSYEQDLEKFAGTSRHFCSFDEEPPRAIWEECLLRLVDTDGDWWISMTPVEGLTWVFDLIYKPWEEGRRPETLVVKVSMHDNPHLTKKGKDKILKNITDDADRQAREEGSFVEIKGLVYKDFQVQLHVRPHFQLQKGMKIWTSLDTGWRHPAAWLWHAVLPSGHIVTFHEIVESERTIESLAAEILEWEAENIISKGFEIYSRTGDPAMRQVREATGTSVIGEYAKRGVYIGVEGVPSGAGSVDIGVNKMTTYLQTLVKEMPLWTVTADCPKLIKEMKGLRWEKYETKTMDQKKPLKTTIDKRNDDAADSLRYFICTQQELTPATVAALRKERINVPSSYYDPYDDNSKQNDYVKYSSSNAYLMEN